MVPKNKLTMNDLEWELDQLSQEERNPVEGRMALASAQLQTAQEAYTSAFQTECDVLRAKRKLKAAPGEIAVANTANVDLMTRRTDFRWDRKCTTINFYIY